MHLAYLISAMTALATISAHPSLTQDQAETQALSAGDLQVRQPVNAFHGSHRFVDSSVNGKRSFKKHRRGNEEKSKGQVSNKRKVKKRSGSCLAKTNSASSLASATNQSTAVVSSTFTSHYYVPSATASSSAESTNQNTQASSSSPSAYWSSSSSATSSTSTLNVENAAVQHSASPSANPSSAQSSASTTTHSSLVIASTTSSNAAAATTSSSSSWTSVDTEGDGPFSGEITYYDLGTDGSAIGACGTSLVDSDKIAAASYDLFDNWPGATANPNTNPICGQYAKVSSGSASVIVQIQDRCPGCDKRHLDLSPSAFLELAALSVGLMDVTWEWVETSSG